MAKGFAPHVLGPGDEVVISIMEHHSNLIPWQQVCRETDAKLVYLYPTPTGQITDDEIAAKIGPATKIVSCGKIGPATKIVSCGHVSNVLGVENPIAKLSAAAHANGAYMVVDAAQSIPHMALDVQKLGADFLAFSAHKALGPMGVGVLWGRMDLLDSNVLGVENPIAKLSAAAHANGAYMVVDAAQSIPHMALDVLKLGADFLAFSAHTALGPMGVGVLWGRRDRLDRTDPVYTGGEMIDSVTEQGATWAPVPEKFEAGTQDAAGISATGVALDYLVNKVGYETVAERERALVHYAMSRMVELPFVDIVGSIYWDQHHGAISFNVRGIHPHDVASIMYETVAERERALVHYAMSRMVELPFVDIVGSIYWDQHHGAISFNVRGMIPHVVASILDMDGVCIRAGHHCAQQLLTWLQVENLACCRASIAVYNDKYDIDRFIDSLNHVWSVFHN